MPTTGRKQSPSPSGAGSSISIDLYDTPNYLDPTTSRNHNAPSPSKELVKTNELKGFGHTLKTLFSWIAFIEVRSGLQEKYTQRFFSTFPEGLPGLGLLILRLMVAGTVQFVTFSSFLGLIRPTFQGWLIAGISIVSSATMVSGFLTPVISALIFIGGILLLVLSPREANSSFAIYLILLSFVIILLGPGAYSIDARLFGRREIILSKKN